MRLPVALVVVTFALAVATVYSDGADAQDDGVPLDSISWRADFNAKVAERNHWRWTLRRVERTGDRLAVSLRFRNNASTGRPILLEDQYLETISLIDEQAGMRFALLAVDGVSGDPTAVDRKKSKTAVFTFEYPIGASAVRFTSRWISMRMGGEASVMRVDFPIDLPPAGADPS